MRKRDLTAALLAALFAGAVGCNATVETGDDDQQQPPPPPPPPVANGCAEDNPVCDPGCGTNQACVFDGNGCGCINVCPQDPVLRQCAGSGPNAGCEAGFVCNATCECEQDLCDEDAPVCPGGGPNSGCEAGFACASDCITCVPLPVVEGDLLDRPSRSTAIDLSLDDTLLAMVNSDDGSVSFFNVRDGQNGRISRIATSLTVQQSEPMSVVLHPDQKRAFVANRAAGTISRIIDVDGTQPSIDGELDVGGEPIGLALDPLGAKLWATNWINGEVLVIDTATMQVERTIAVGGNPWAIAITNDLDRDTADEKVLVTQFFARPRAGAANPEGTDDGREGLVQIISIANPSEIRETTLAPKAECFATDTLTSGCFPNQLHGITVHTAFGLTRAYVVSTAASPRGPAIFNHNVQALVSVIDVDAEAEVTELTTNLNQLIASTQTDNDGDESVGRRFLNVPNAIDFVNRDDAAIGYVSSAGSDIALRVVFAESGAVSVGSQSNFNLAAGQNPQGIVITHRIEKAGAYVANLISRDVSELAFDTQSKVDDIESTEQPAPGTDAFAIWRGKRFFNTSTGIWAREGWGSCVACHPLGLTDNVTWQFAAGPRQTIALDGQFASNDPTDMRALNWTAIFDETADFENNTRGTSGGSGAIRNAAGPIASAMANNFVGIAAEDGTTIENHQGMNGSLEFVIRNRAICANENTCPDWDQIDRYIQTIRSTSAKSAETALIERGRLVFEDGGCDKCHAGPKWTISRTFYVQEQSEGDLGSRVFEANRARNASMDPSSLSQLGLATNVNTDTTLIAGDDSDGGTPPLLRMACNIRNVGTFAAEGGADEVRANATAAQGRSGFNPPSLLGIAAGAPYFHNGAAATLEAMFEPRFGTHLTAGNPNFIPTADQRTALAAFLASIDESTTPFDIIDGSVLCPLDFSTR
jgi:YVTN family beta-propeller protein